MTVYVDSMRARVGRMIMCHMVADSRAELDAMADRIGVARRWIQQADTPKEHYDIALAARAQAIAAGAVEITRRQLGAIIRDRAVPDAERCAHDVYIQGDGVGRPRNWPSSYYQCPKHRIHGAIYCRRHAKMHGQLPKE